MVSVKKNRQWISISVICLEVGYLCAVKRDSLKGYYYKRHRQVLVLISIFLHFLLVFPSTSSVEGSNLSTQFAEMILLDYVELQLHDAPARLILKHEAGTSPTSANWWDGGRVLAKFCEQWATCSTRSWQDLRLKKEERNWLKFIRALSLEREYTLKLQTQVGSVRRNTEIIHLKEYY